ncbi:hypothetical protein D3C84_386710 [compost metagenome]
MHVEDDVAVVGDNALAVNRVAAQFHQLPGHMAAGHGDNLHGQGEGAKHRHQLAAVGNADEGLGDGSDDFFARQGRATAFDQGQVLVAFVGTIDVELKLADGVQFVDRDPVALQARGGGLGAGDCAVEGTLVLGQGVDKAVGGRTGTHADNALVVELGQNEVDRGLGDGLFELVLGHAGSGAGGDSGRLLV